MATDNSISLIPYPAELQTTGQIFHLSDQAPLYVGGGPQADEAADYLHDELAKMGLTLQPREDSIDAPGVSLSLTDEESLAAEGAYRLWTGEAGATVVAGTSAGLFYGIQTLLQLIPEHGGHGSAAVPGVEIVDYPRYEWRGMHLDVCRHFFSVEFIKKYIDLLARHKFNRFHWHLTDDQGWRIEILKYPQLTKVGAWRREADGELYGGYYSQEEIRDVVAYALRRQVTVVPEIELPGHAQAALAAYPEFSCTGGPHHVATEWGVFDDVFCPGNEKTFGFLRDVLTEVAALFPGRYVHIGGDECPKVRWEAHELCQARMKSLGYTSSDELQSYFVTRIARELNHLGKQAIGWDEILDGGAPRDALVMAWRSAEKGIVAAATGHDVVMSPMSHCYFDHYQALGNEPKAIGGLTPLERVYAFEPTPPTLIPELQYRFLGAQGNVWTEYMADERHVEYMVFPRLCALAEVLWSPRKKHTFDDFRRRLMGHLKQLDRWGVNYRAL